MPIKINNNPFLKILIQNHSIAHYFQKTMIEQFLQTNGNQALILKRFNQLKIKHQTVSYYNLQNEMETRIATNINQNLNDYLAQWQLTLAHQKWHPIDFTAMIKQSIQYLAKNQQYQQQFRDYTPYCTIHINRPIDVYLKTGESIETQLIDQLKSTNPLDQKIIIQSALEERQIIRQLIHNLKTTAHQIKHARRQPQETYLIFQARVVKKSSQTLHQLNQTTFNQWHQQLTIYQQTLWSIYDPMLNLNHQPYYLNDLEMDLCTEIFHQRDIDHKNDIIKHLSFFDYQKKDNPVINHVLKHYYQICTQIEKTLIKIIDHGTI